MPDDAYYYLQIALNQANGFGLTVDRLHQTNGFQPLWMLLLVGIARLGVSTPEALLVVTKGLCVLLLAITATLQTRLVQQRWGSLAAIAGALLLAFPRFMNVPLMGMESCLVFPIFLLLCREIMNSGSVFSGAPVWRDGWTGFWLGLLMLARLDSVFIPVALAVSAAWHSWSSSQGRPALRLLLVVLKGLALFWPMLVFIAPYLAWNFLSFGHFVPISGVLKSTFPEPHFQPTFLRGEFVALIGLAAMASALPLFGIGPRDAIWRLVCALTGGVTLHLAHGLFFMSWGVFIWHFVIYIPVGVIGLACCLTAFDGRVDRQAVRLGLVCVAALQLAALWISIQRVDRSFRGASMEAAIWVRTHLPEETVMGMKDSGAFTYFSGRRVVNMDGLVNSFEYMQELCSRGLDDFLQRAGVQYIVQHQVPTEVMTDVYEEYEQVYKCRLPGGTDGSIVMRRECEIYRGSPYLNSEDEPGQLVIWRYGTCA